MPTGEFQVGLAFLLMIIVCYIAGRLHQWAKHGIDREAAYRDGYDHATHSLFSLATSVRTKLKTDRQATVNTTTEMPAPAVVRSRNRGRAEVRPVPVVPFPSIPQSNVSRPKTRGPRHAA